MTLANRRSQIDFHHLGWPTRLLARIRPRSNQPSDRPSGRTRQPVTLRRRTSSTKAAGVPTAEGMKPPLRVITRLIAAAYALAGIGVAMAIYRVGGVANKIVLLPLAAGFLVLAVRLWSESVVGWGQGLPLSDSDLAQPRPAYAGRRGSHLACHLGRVRGLGVPGVARRTE